MRTQYSRTGMNGVPLNNAGALANAIRSARKDHGLTQAELAGLSGTGTRFVNELEHGKPTVSLTKVLAVLAVLGLAVYLLDQDKK